MIKNQNVVVIGLAADLQGMVKWRPTSVWKVQERPQPPDVTPIAIV